MSFTSEIDPKLVLRNKQYLLDIKLLTRFANDRGIAISQKLLNFYQSFDYAKPICQDDGKDYYDQYQIYEIALLDIAVKNTINSVMLHQSGQEKQFKEIISYPFQSNDFLRNKVKRFWNFLPLLLELRYYYLPEVLGFATLKIFNFDGEYKPQTYEEWESDRDSYDAASLLSELSLNPEDIDVFRLDLLSIAHQIDPADSWYVFIRKLRRLHNYDFKRIKGNLRLAHDLYQMAEMLTKFLEKATGKDWVQPEDMFDLTGGRWKDGYCLNCGNKFREKVMKEKFCNDCKGKMIATTVGSWKCKKCDKVLLKYVDANEIFNEMFHTAGKGQKKGLYINIEYGLVSLSVECSSCSTVNNKQISHGWI